VVDYYKTLNIGRKATPAEIKSAYRKLARKRHPDLNGGSDESAREFAQIARAYEILSDPQERAYYDAKLKQHETGGWVLYSENLHAQRMRNMASRSRWDRAVDLYFEAERQETAARTKAVFTTVSLFLSTFIVAMLKPKLWQSFDGLTGRAILLTLFVIGLWHLASRMRECFEHYTYSTRPIEQSIITAEELPEKPFARSTALAFLVFGFAACAIAGLIIGGHTHYIVEDLVFFDRQVHLHMAFYPPIGVLIIDTMHSVASKID
jgi:molecular chaperone DnaJ